MTWRQQYDQGLNLIKGPTRLQSFEAKTVQVAALSEPASNLAEQNQPGDLQS